MKENTYNSKFFQEITDASTTSASIVVPCVVELLQPIKVLDIGCGLGAWVNEFLQCGCDAYGVDGPYVRLDQLLIPRERFIAHDLRTPLTIRGTYDLVTCMEVAEHLPQARAKSLVSDLTSLAPIVIFGAAIPGQGGRGHINEQWPEYWRDLFAAVQYSLVDCFRHRFWYDNRVASWYSQNLFLYTHNSIASKYQGLHREAPLSAVHPKFFANRVQASPWKLFPALVGTTVKLLQSKARIS